MGRSIFSFLAGLLLLVFLGGAAGSQRTLPAFQLLGQDGRPVEIAPSGGGMLVILYRGDW